MQVIKNVTSYIIYSRHQSYLDPCGGMKLKHYDKNSVVSIMNTVSLNVFQKSLVTKSTYLTGVHTKFVFFFFFFLFFYVMTEAMLIQIHNVVLSCVSVFG